MGQYLFRLPDIGEGVAEAEITAWHVKPGDVVPEDGPLLDVMTDKATVDITSPLGGTVVAIHGGIGSKAPVGSVLVELDVAGDTVELHADKAVAGPSDVNSAVSSPLVNSESEKKAVNSDPAASPSTRRRAMEWGIELKDVLGTGPNNRILTEDLERYRQAKTGKPQAPARTGIDEIRIVGMRRRIADKMQESKRKIPHFSYVEELDLTELESLRADLNSHRSGAGGDERPKLTLLPFFMRALVSLVPEYQDINAHYDEAAGVLKRYHAIHIGIATQTSEGLMVPVVRHAETRNLWDCARELSRVTQAARDGKAAREELSGSTITLTSLGPLGGIAATPIINHPEVAIIGPNKLVERPVIEGAFVSRRKVMNLSTSFDHRIIDGHVAARFVQELKRLLEHPALLFLE